MPSLRNSFVCLSAVAVCVTLYLYSSGFLTRFSLALPKGRDDSTSLLPPSDSATTGKLFTGKRVQKFPSELKSKSYHRQQPNTKHSVLCALPKLSPGSKAYRNQYRRWKRGEGMQKITIIFCHLDEM